MMQSHSHLFNTEHFQKFFTKLQAIAPDRLSWSESGGNLICKQKPVDPSESKNTLHTVESVMKKLHLTIKPDEHKIMKHDNGTMVYVFTIKGIYNQLNRKPWIMKHIDEVVTAANENKSSGNEMRK